MAPTVAIVGNPNSGKTTLFNGLTGGHHRTGNWPGVTVEKRVGTIPLYAPSVGMVTGAERGVSATTVAEAPARIPGNPELVDLPGIYSLNATSEDEIIARDVLLSGDYDLVLNIIDASNLERNLFLTLQLIEMGVPLLVVLNMTDLAENRGIRLDAEHLEHHLGVPVVAIQANTRAGANAARTALQNALSEPRRSPAQVSYPEPLSREIDAWTELLGSDDAIGLNPRYAAIRLLEGDPWVSSIVEHDGVLSTEAIEVVRERVRAELHEDLDIVVADGRYGFIHGVARDVTERRPTRESVTDRIDRVVMSRVLGIPVFLAAMYLVFWGTVAVGGAFIDFFDIAAGTIFVDGLGALLASIGAPGWLTTVVAGGVGAGIQTVATFIPIIFMMFFMLSLLEDSGYMARAAFVMDRLMRWIGLPGKSFVPLLVGFGCTVPAISATRTLESRKDRFMTIFMAPFMSCGARLPVYALFAAALFPAFAGTVVFGLYLAGLVLAILTGLLLKNTIFKGEYSHFVMELPPYHAPRIGMILRTSWYRLLTFVKRAGLTIMVVVTILAVLNSLGTDGSFGNEDSDTSVLASVGRTLTPVFTPMGIEEDNWPATVGLFTGLFAKEAIVGTLSALYAQNEAGAAPEAEGDGGFDLLGGLGEAVASIPEALAGLGGALRDPLGTGMISSDENAVGAELELEGGIFSRMRSMFTPAAGMAYLVFVLIYFPCVAALGAAVQEMGRGYAALMATYLTVLAYAVGVLTYNVIAGPQLVPVVLSLATLLGIYLVFRMIGRTTSRDLARAV